VIYSDTPIKCSNCGFTASEWEFATNNPQEPLRCPRCKETATLEDTEEVPA